MLGPPYCFFFLNSLLMIQNKKDMENFIRVTLRNFEEPELFIKKASIDVSGGFILINLVKERSIINTDDIQKFLIRQLQLQTKFRKLEKAYPDDIENISYTFEIEGENEIIEKAWICLDTEIYDAETVDALPEGKIAY